MFDDDKKKPISLPPTRSPAYLAELNEWVRRELIASMRIPPPTFPVRYVMVRERNLEEETKRLGNLMLRGSRGRLVKVMMARIRSRGGL